MTGSVIRQHCHPTFIDAFQLVLRDKHEVMAAISDSRRGARQREFERLITLVIDDEAQRVPCEHALDRAARNDHAIQTDAKLCEAFKDVPCLTFWQHGPASQNSPNFRPESARVFLHADARERGALQRPFRLMHERPDDDQNADQGPDVEAYLYV
jgi:hypothetical protein